MQVNRFNINPLTNSKYAPPHAIDRVIAANDNDFKADGNSLAQSSQPGCIGERSLAV